MKFKFLGIEITIRKEYMVIGILMLIIFLAFWGWYIKTNHIEVFKADEESTKQETQGQGHDIENQDEIEQISDNIENSAETPNEPLFININTADANSLTKLYNIGEVKANAIIEYREQNGPFKSIDEIKNVKGIGEATFQKMKDMIVVGTEGRKPFKMNLLK